MRVIETKSLRDYFRARGQEQVAMNYTAGVCRLADGALCEQFGKWWDEIDGEKSVSEFVVDDGRMIEKWPFSLSRPADAVDNKGVRFEVRKNEEEERIEVAILSETDERKGILIKLEVFTGPADIGRETSVVDIGLVGFSKEAGQWQEDRLNQLLATEGDKKVMAAMLIGDLLQLRSKNE